MNPNPYPGLRPFLESEAPYFCGRDNEIEELLHLLAAKRFVAVTGVSGSGKSSLVRAGVIPVLRCGFAEALQGDWQVLDFRPGGGPLAELTRALGLSDSFSAANDLKNYALEKMSPGRRLLVFVDQFEEIFDYRREQYAEDGGNETALFVNLLLAAADHRENPIHVVLTMRSDFLGECAQFRGLPEALNYGHYLVPRLTRLQQAQVITGPAAAFDVEFEPSLVQQLLNDSEDNPDRLPVLQHILKLLWENRQGCQVITPEVYKSSGGWMGALERDGNGVLGGFSEAEQNGGIARLFQWITGVGVAGQAMRRARPFSELPAVTGLTTERLNEIIGAFKARDFLQTSSEGNVDDERIDLIHESVIWNWPWLRELVAAEGAEAGRLNFLRESARIRQRLTGLSLAQGEQLERRAENFPEWARRYISEGDRQTISSWVRHSRRRQRLNLGLFILALLLAATGYWQVRAEREGRAIAIARADEAQQGRSRAEAQSRRIQDLATEVSKKRDLATQLAEEAQTHAQAEAQTNKARDLARVATIESESDPQLALSLALYAWQIADPKPYEVLEAVNRATQAAPIIGRGYAPTPMQIAFQHDGTLTFAGGAPRSISPYYFSIGEIPLLDPKTISPPGMLEDEFWCGQSGSLVSVAVSSNDTAAVGCSDGTLGLFKLGERALITRFRSSIRIISTLGVNGEDILSVNSIGKVAFSRSNQLLWTAETTGAIHSVSLGRGGRWAILEGTEEGTDREPREASELWDMQSGKQIHTIGRHAVFDPTGHFVAYSRYDEIYVENIETGWSNDFNRVGKPSAIALGPGGDLSAFGYSTGEIVLRIGFNNRLALLTRSNAIDNMLFSDDGSKLVTVSGNDISMWDVKAVLAAAPLLSAAQDALADRPIIAPGGVPKPEKFDALLPLARKLLIRTLTRAECKQYLQMSACPEGI